MFAALRLGRYRFLIKPIGAISLPAYQGSTWRGVIGTALSRLVCPWPRVRCRKCSAHASCAYGFLYEACSDEKGFADLPRPYLFSPSAPVGNAMCVEMTLIGKAGDFLPHIVTAWIKAGGMGTGKGKGLFDLVRVEQIQTDGGLSTIYTPEMGAAYDKTTFPLADFLSFSTLKMPMKIALMTPLRLRNKGSNVGSADWPIAFFSLAVRLSLLNQAFCGGTRPGSDAWADLKKFFFTPGLIRDTTRWFDWKRYSSRQHRHIPMGGIIGECLVDPTDNQQTWRQWWQTGALFHMGKGVSMGLGKISIQSHNDSPKENTQALKEEKNALA
jgi:hypothetical protein